MKNNKSQGVDIVYQVEKYMADKFDGKLFVHISLIKIGRQYSVDKDWYTVLNGIVYCIEGTKLTPSGDKLISMESECKRVGVYNPNKTYKRVIKYYTYSQLKKRLTL